MAAKLSVALRNAMYTAFINALANGVVHVYDGIQPDDVEDAESGNYLGYISNGGGAVVSGDPTNGIEWEISGSKVVIKTSEEWKLVVATSGTARSFRFYDNDIDTGADGTPEYFRMDGNVATTGANLNLASTTLLAGTTVPINSFEFELPF